MRSIAILFAAAASMMATQASAVTVTFDINRTFSQGGPSAIDILEQPVSIGGAGQFIVDPGFSSSYLDFSFDTGTFATTADELEGFHFLRSYAPGEVLSAATFTEHQSDAFGAIPGIDWDTILVDGQTVGVWSSNHSGFLGFRADGGELGYIGYRYIRSGSVSTIILGSGAYDTDTSGSASFVLPQSVTAPVPVPASLPLLALGLGGLAYLGRRTRKAA